MKGTWAIHSSAFARWKLRAHCVMTTDIRDFLESPSTAFFKPKRFFFFHSSCKLSSTVRALPDSIMIEYLTQETPSYVRILTGVIYNGH
jgi:hypothetical protein